LRASAGAAPCHVWVDALEPKCEFADGEWAVLPGPPTPRAARGEWIREIDVARERVAVLGDELDVPAPELPVRLAEAALARLLAAIGAGTLDLLWKWDNPLAALNPAQGGKP
jgi:hypothetical protein